MINILTSRFIWMNFVSASVATVTTTTTCSTLTTTSTITSTTPCSTSGCYWWLCCNLNK